MTWLDPVSHLGGDPTIARATEADLLSHYAEPHRHYHNLDHIHAIIRDSATLARELTLSEVDHSLVMLAAAAHDVIYNGHPGQDERDSATWAREQLLAAGVAEDHAARVESLILATATHAAPQDDVPALALLDADLAILGSAWETYDRYRTAVRQEYTHLDDPTWLRGRTAILTDLLSRQPLYATTPARTRWESAAKANIARELRLIRTPDHR